MSFQLYRRCAILDQYCGGLVIIYHNNSVSVDARRSSAFFATWGNRFHGKLRLHTEMKLRRLYFRLESLYFMLTQKWSRAILRPSLGTTVEFVADIWSEITFKEVICVIIIILQIL